MEYRSHTNFSEVWHVGGDAYTAVAVAKKTGTGSWVVYNIFRDHLGTITHLKNGSSIDEYSYDAWGRRRDKDNWSYTLSGEPALSADRGFTGHEYLEDFNLYNMNGRLGVYPDECNESGNPVLGRFLSPDPYIADPSFTQSYNRYSYVLNNPLKYNDPTGELPLWALWGIATAGNWLFGGLDNWLNKGISFKQSFSTANNPIVFSGNYHPGSNSWSNTQVNAHRLVGAMANSERGVHSYVAGFSGMGRNGEGPLFTSTPFDQFVGESPLAGAVAAVKNVDAVSGPAIDVGPYEGRYWRHGMPTEYYVGNNILVVSVSNHTYLNILNDQLKYDFFRKLYSSTPYLSRNYRFHPVNTDLSYSMGLMTFWSYLVLDAPLWTPHTFRNAHEGCIRAMEFSRSNHHKKLLRYYRNYHIIK